MRTVIRRAADPRALLPLLAAILGQGQTPILTGEYTAAPDAPTPIYDQLIRERAAGRDSRGRFVKWGA